MVEGSLACRSGHRARFEELELVYGLDEVDRLLSDESAFIRQSCRNDPDVLIELSLRNKKYLNPIPDLAQAWSLSDVVLEFQCPNGVDHEIDARHKDIQKRMDDRTDAESREKQPN